MVCAKAASACGSQKVMSMARYNSMAAVSSARACSRWPVAIQYQGRGGSGPGAGACRVPRPGRGPGGSESPACSLSGGSRRAAMSPRRRRAYAWWPRSWCYGRAPAPARRGHAPPPGGRPAAAPPPGRDDRAPDSYCFHCSRLFYRLREQRHGVGDAPPRVYAAPKAAATWGKSGRSAS